MLALPRRGRSRIRAGDGRLLAAGCCTEDTGALRGALPSSMQENFSEGQHITALVGVIRRFLHVQGLGWVWEGAASAGRSASILVQALNSPNFDLSIKTCLQRFKSMAALRPTELGGVAVVVTQSAHARSIATLPRSRGSFHGLVRS